MTLPTSWHSPTVSISAERPSAKWIVARVLALLGHYYQVETDPEIRRLMLADWIEDLADIPQAAIEKAVTEWRRSSGSRPKPGDIRKLALSHVVRPMARKEEPAPFGAPPLTEEERARRADLARELGLRVVQPMPKEPS